MFDVLEEERQHYPSHYDFSVGDKVTHSEYPQFGIGTITERKGNHLVVHFPNRKRGKEYRAFAYYLKMVKRRPRSFLLDDRLFEI